MVYNFVDARFVMVKSNHDFDQNTVNLAVAMFGTGDLPFWYYDDGTNSQQLCRGASKETLVAPNNKVVKMLQGKMASKGACTKAVKEIRNQNVTEYPANPLKG